MSAVKTITVIGSGKLGAGILAAVASRGFEAIGVDTDPRVVELINAGKAPVAETELDRYLAEHHSRISATGDHAAAIMRSSLSFVIVPTPSDSRGVFSLTHALRAFHEIGRALAKTDHYHVVVLVSTVLPGATRYGLLPTLEQQSGKQCGRDFGLCYSPCFVALGRVIQDFLSPDFTLIGEHDERAGKMLAETYSALILNHARSLRMSLENAEIAKIAVNTFVTTKISFANMLAEICQCVPGGDVEIVLNALGNDTRIGAKYLTGGTGYGGPCFPRDNAALAWFARTVGAPAELALATDAVNRSTVKRRVAQLRRHVSAGSTIAVLGLSYKTGSSVIEDSQGIALAKALAAAGFRVLGYDPLATVQARAELEGLADVTNSLDVCLRSADAIVIANPDPEFLQLGTDHCFGRAPVVVLDMWRLLSRKLANQPGIEYLPYGRFATSKEDELLLRDLWSGCL